MFKVITPPAVLVALKLEIVLGPVKVAPPTEFVVKVPVVATAPALLFSFIVLLDVKLTLLLPAVILFAKVKILPAPTVVTETAPVPVWVTASTSNA